MKRDLSFKFYINKEKRLMVDTFTNSQKTVKISSYEIASRFKSKKEIHMLLTVEVGAYLPPVTACTIYWLQSILSGQSKCK